MSGGACKPLKLGIVHHKPSMLWGLGRRAAWQQDSRKTKCSLQTHVLAPAQGSHPQQLVQRLASPAP